MLKENQFTKLIWVLSGGVFIYLVLILLNIFDPSSGLLIKSNNLQSIKASLASETTDVGNLTLTSIQGSKNYVALTYKDSRYSGRKHTYHVIYDTKTSKVIKNIDTDGIFLNLIDASIIQHIQDELFIVVDSKGDIYSLNFESNKANLKLIGSSDINKSNVFKYIYSNNTLCVLTRQYLSKYNEMTLNEHTVHKIEFNKKYTSATTDSISYDNSFIYSFVVNSSGSIGIVGSSYVELNGEEVNKYTVPADNEYLSKSATENNDYKLIDSSSIWVQFFDGSDIIKLNNSAIELSYLPISYTLESKFGADVSVAKNVPVVIGDDYSIYSAYQYITLLYDPAILPSASIFKFAGNEPLESEVTIRSDIFKYDYKNYIAFFNSNEGLVGIDSSGEMTLIIDSLISYFNNKSILYIKNGNLYFKK